MRMKPLTPMGERIHDGMIASGMSSERDLARKANVPPQTLHRWMHYPLKSIDAAILLRISDAIGLSSRWVLFGNGSPHKHLPVTPTEAHLIQSYRALPPEARSALMRCVLDLLESSE